MTALADLFHHSANQEDEHVAVASFSFSTALPSAAPENITQPGSVATATSTASLETKDQQPGAPSGSETGATSPSPSSPDSANDALPVSAALLEYAGAGLIPKDLRAAIEAEVRVTHPQRDGESGCPIVL